MRDSGHKHAPRKRFGQNFLNDPGVINRIIAAIHPQPKDTLIEIGPGLGALTQPLLKACGALTVVELDRDIIPKLQDICKNLGTLTIHQADVLDFDFHQAIPDKQKARIVGNLPYNISTPLIFHLFEQLDCIQDMHFMLQKEVVDRMTATPDTKQYGRLTVMVQYACAAYSMFDVPPSAFTPPPKVQSAIVRLVPHPTLPFKAKNETLFADIVREAFNHRRKTVHNSLKNMLCEGALEAVGISPAARPENLSVEDYVKLSNWLNAQGDAAQSSPSER